MGNSTSKERNKSDAGPSCNASPECTLHECLPSPQVANVTEENLNRLNNSSESGSEEVWQFAILLEYYVSFWV